jgi:translation initiation factor eIF-2B subunit delta
VRVSCAESRPGGEGREEAAALAAAGLEVEFLPDAALGLALAEAQAALLGADAVAPDWFANKVGSGPLAAAATVGGTPVYVLAGSEKLVGRELAALMSLPEAAADSVWPEAPPHVRIRAPLFERVPWDRVAALVTEAGVLSGRMVGEACEGAARQVRAHRLVALLRTRG